jgi:predicted aldo/keto reductase-like oxidoreductase
MRRREFLMTAAAGTLGAGASAAGNLPRRRYRDQVELSIIGFGGIVVVGLEQQEANRLVAESVELGVNYFDVAPSYGDGEAELKLGPALQPYRKQVFLACKTQQRDAAGARRELERSLERLRTDHFDLYQHHAVTRLEDVERIFAPGGAQELFLKAREEGKVRYLGFSAHSVAAALALLDRFPFDSVLFPVNFVCYSQGNFGPQVVARARERGAARLALKALAYTRWPKGTDRTKTATPKTWYQPVTDPELASLALRFTLSEDITAAIPPGDEQIYRVALRLALGFRPLSAEERKQLLGSAAGVEPIFRA